MRNILSGANLRRGLALAAMCLLIGCQKASAASAAPSIGMNLTSVNYYGRENPFIDRIKTASVWQGSSASFTPLIQLDGIGNPLSFPAGNRDLSMLVQVDPEEYPTTDRYVFTYTGTATFSFLYADVVSNQPGRIVIEANSPSVDYVHIIMRTISDRDPPKNFHLVREDQVDQFQNGKVFNQAFLEKVRKWGSIRTMDWTSTNGAQISTWAKRNVPGSLTWQDDANTGGVPIEILVQLANEAHVNLWYNIPAHADDDYVRRALTYIKANLDSSLTLDLEYSNEVWNWGFEQSKYALAQGNLLWGKDVNHDGIIDVNNPAEHYGTGWLEFYGYRSAQIASIAKSVFGTESYRLYNVIATQAAVPGREQLIFRGVLAAGKGSVASLFKKYAITTYFGLFDSPHDVATVLSWARSGSAGMDAAFREFQYGGSLDAKFSLADLRTLYAQQAAIAAANGLTLVAYEGGMHITPYSFAKADQDEANAFLYRLLGDPRMKTVYEKMVDDFGNAGGRQLMAFADVSGPLSYNTFGILSSIYETGSPRYDALVGKAAASRGIMAPAKAVKLDREQGL